MRRLAIVGASARAAAQSASRDGYQVIALDQFGDADLRLCAAVQLVPQLDATLVPMLAATKCDGWLYVGGVESRPALLTQLAAVSPLRGCTAEAAAWLRSAAAWQTLTSGTGIRLPEIAYQPPTAGRWLAKTWHSAGGLGVAAASSLAGAADYWQRYIAGPVWGATYAVTPPHGAALWGVCEHLHMPGWSHVPRQFQYQGSVGPLAIGTKHRRQLESLGQQLVQQPGVAGLVGIDLVLHEDELWLLEVNPRYPASAELLELASGVSAISLHLAACRGEVGDCRFTPAEHFAKLVRYAPRDIVVDRQLSGELLTMVGGDCGWLADIPTAGTRVPAGAPLVTILARDATRVGLWMGLRQLAIELDQQLSNCQERPPCELA